uniref:Uncharacterized protein n=1 Tax=Oryza punctata TaxID=4537 RepID=A0A0E0LZ28_ORYPU
MIGPIPIAPSLPPLHPISSHGGKAEMGKTRDLLTPPPPVARPATNLPIPRYSRESRRLYRPPPSRSLDNLLVVVQHDLLTAYKS